MNGSSFHIPSITHETGTEKDQFWTDIKLLGNLYTPPLLHENGGPADLSKNLDYTFSNNIPWFDGRDSETGKTQPVTLDENSYL
jgi:hypothetical protein